jgi:type IV secretory pathway TrbF-like protein
MKTKGSMNWVILIVVLLIALFIVQYLLNKKSKESFIPYLSSNTPTGSSQLYGWTDSTYNSTLTNNRDNTCCSCSS